MKDSRNEAIRRERRRSKTHFKARVEPGHEAETKSLRRFVEKTFRGYTKKGTYSGEDIKKRTSVTEPVVRAAEKKGFGHYIY